MRNVHRNKRELWYSIQVGSTPILDDYGNDTLEVEAAFSSPLFLLATVSANVGQEAVEVFGSHILNGLHSPLRKIVSICSAIDGHITTHCSTGNILCCFSELARWDI